MSLSKIMTWDEALKWRKESREKGEKVVFTNGCFDLLHMGHISLLQEAKKLGNKLIVGLNSDESTRKIKGPKRPLRPQQERAEVLAGLKPTDSVVIFDEVDPLRLILFIKPNILVKGGDWEIEEVIGAKEVFGWDGKVFSIPTLSGRSTTKIIKTIEGINEKTL